MILETERLYLRRIIADDRADLCEILQDAETMYAYEHPFSDEEADRWIDKILQSYDTFSYGPMAVISKTNGSFVGQAGLSMQKCDGDDILEIGYLLKKRFWHNGYAIEAALAVKRYAFEVLKAQTVYSKIKYNNFPSQRVAERLGMRRIKDFNVFYYGKDMLHYLYAVSVK